MTRLLFDNHGIQKLLLELTLGLFVQKWGERYLEPVAKWFGFSFPDRIIQASCCVVQFGEFMCMVLCTCFMF